jgi:hypothetical protein
MTDHELAQVRRALQVCRSALADLHEGMTAIEGELRRLEALADRSEAAAPGPGALARVAAAEPGVRDLIVDRVEELCGGCEVLLQRPLRGDERPVVLGWAQLERAGEPVPVAEILALARYLLAKPTPDGTLPSTLRWCESTVQTLSRAPLRSLPPPGRTGRAAQLSALYDRLADELDAKDVVTASPPPRPSPAKWQP